MRLLFLSGFLPFFAPSEVENDELNYIIGILDAVAPPCGLLHCRVHSCIHYT